MKLMTFSLFVLDSLCLDTPIRRFFYSDQQSSKAHMQILFCNQSPAKLDIVLFYNPPQNKIIHTTQNQVFIYRNFLPKKLTIPSNEILQQITKFIPIYDKLNLQVVIKKKRALLTVIQSDDEIYMPVTQSAVQILEQWTPLLSKTSSLESNRAKNQ